MDMGGAAQPHRMIHGLRRTISAHTEGEETMAKKKPDKLAQEVNMALAAGMSYGKWKALQTPTVIEEPKPVVRRMKKCALCGAEFPVYDNRPRSYCGEQCRQVINDRRKYEWRKAHGKSKTAWLAENIHTELQERSEEKSV